VTNREDQIVSVICPEFEAPTGICHLKQSAFQDGLLSDLFGRADDNPLDNPAPRCTLA
jgi:hypothetical protein